MNYTCLSNGMFRKRLEIIYTHIYTYNRVFNLKKYIVFILAYINNVREKKGIRCNCT